MLEQPAVADQQYEFYGGQQVNKVYADMADAVDKDWQWPPIHEYVATQGDDDQGQVRRAGRGRHRGAAAVAGRGRQVRRAAGHHGRRTIIRRPRRSRGPASTPTRHGSSTATATARVPGGRGKRKAPNRHGLAGFLFTVPFMVLFLTLFIAPLALRAVPEPVPRAARRRHHLRRARQLRRGPQGHGVHRRRRARRAVHGRPGAGHAGPGARVRAHPRLGQGAGSRKLFRVGVLRARTPCRP